MKKFNWKNIWINVRLVLIFGLVCFFIFIHIKAKLREKAEPNLMVVFLGDDNFL